MLRSVISGVKVIRKGREFCSNGVDLFNEGRDVEFLASSADSQFRGSHTVSKLAIGETELFRPAQQQLCDRRKVTGSIAVSVKSMDA